MANDAERKLYEVVNAYRNDGIKLKQFEILHLLPVEAAGPLSLGNIKLVPEADLPAE